jgi:hypothetical protein
MTEIEPGQEGTPIPSATPFRMCVEINEEFALTAPSQAVQKVLVSEFNAARVALARAIVEARP